MSVGSFPASAPVGAWVAGASWKAAEFCSYSWLRSLLLHGLPYSCTCVELSSQAFGSPQWLLPGALGPWPGTLPIQHAFPATFPFALSSGLLNKGAEIIIPMGKINKRRLSELK